MTITDPQFDVSSLDKGKESYSWNGWAIEKFTIGNGAWASPKGVFRNGHYGYLKSYSVNKQGQWILDDK